MPERHINLICKSTPEKVFCLPLIRLIILPLHTLTHAQYCSGNVCVAYVSTIKLKSSFFPTQNAETSSESSLSCVHLSMETKHGDAIFCVWRA